MNRVRTLLLAGLVIFGLCLSLGLAATACSGADHRGGGTPTTVTPNPSVATTTSTNPTLVSQPDHAVAVCIDGSRSFTKTLFDSTTVALGSALAGVGAILLVPIVTLQVSSMTDLVKKRLAVVSRPTRWRGTVEARTVGIAARVQYDVATTERILTAGRISVVTRDHWAAAYPRAAAPFFVATQEIGDWC